MSRCTVATLAAVTPVVAVCGDSKSDGESASTGNGASSVRSSGEAKTGGKLTAAVPGVLRRWDKQRDLASSDMRALIGESTATWDLAYTLLSGVDRRDPPSPAVRA